jgi:hypothetical protein
VGPLAPQVVTRNGRKQAIFIEARAKDYRGLTSGNQYYQAVIDRNSALYGALFDAPAGSRTGIAGFAEQGYMDWNGGWGLDRGDGTLNVMGDNQVCFYKVQWGGKPANPASSGLSVPANDNQPIVNAYSTEFSYELLIDLPDAGEGGGHIFGNFNPSHCGFGFNCSGGVINFQYQNAFGGNDQAKIQMSKENLTSFSVQVRAGTHPDATTGIPEWGGSHHLVVTYKKTTGNVSFYVDGQLFTYVNGDPVLMAHGIKFPEDYYGATGGNHTSDRRNWNAEWLGIGTNCHQSGMPNQVAHDGTGIAIARIFGHALTQAEVTKLYNYVTPE